jgi:hypothetical protein
MSGGYISYFADSAYFSDADLASLLPDLQSQVANEFNYYWGMYAYLDDSGGGNPVIVIDSTNYPNPPAGALGFHSIDSNDNPYAIVFADLCVANGVPVTATISHETLEMLADQLTDVATLYPPAGPSPDTGDGFIILQEVCDPCEALLYYEGAVNNSILSDFVTPQWYLPGAAGPYDFLGLIPGSWQLASGGYVCYQEINLPGWTCPVADEARKAAARAGERITRVDNPMAGTLRHRQDKGKRISMPPAREVTVVGRKDVRDTNGRNGTPRKRPQLPSATQVKAQKTTEKV